MTTNHLGHLDHPPAGKAWSRKLSEVARYARYQCGGRADVHSCQCSITGDPGQLVINFACTATDERYVADLMQFVNDELLPQLEQVIGIQFEVRNLQFAVQGQHPAPAVAAGRAAQAGTAEAGWLIDPFSTGEQPIIASPALRSDATQAQKKILS